MRQVSEPLRLALAGTAVHTFYKEIEERSHDRSRTTPAGRAGGNEPTGLLARAHRQRRTAGRATGRADPQLPTRWRAAADLAQRTGRIRARPGRARRGAGVLALVRRPAAQPGAGAGHASGRAD